MLEGRGGVSSVSCVRGEDGKAGGGPNIDQWLQASARGQDRCHTLADSMDDMGEEEDIKSNFCCIATLSSIVATCCLTDERREAEIENRARKEEKRRVEMKRIQEDIKKKELKRRDDERRRKEERRRRDEKKRIDKQQKDEKAKKSLRENDDTSGVHNLENIHKLQGMRGAQPDIHKRDKIQWEIHPNSEKHDFATKLETKTGYSNTTTLPSAPSRELLKQFDRSSTLATLRHIDSTSSNDEHNTHKAQKKISHAYSHEAGSSSNFNTDKAVHPSVSTNGDNAHHKNQKQIHASSHAESRQTDSQGLASKRLHSIQSLDGDQNLRRKVGEGHNRERLRSIHSLDSTSSHRDQVHRSSDTAKLQKLRKMQKLKSNSSQSNAVKTKSGAKIKIAKKK